MATKRTEMLRKKRLTQWTLLGLVPLTIALGWKYPVLGYTVPLVMLTAMVGSLIRGRYVCGNLCPRGGFLDRVMSKLSRNAKVPDFFRKPAFRWSVFVLLMGFMLYRGFQNPTSFAHWGVVFWSMCAVTTAVAVILALAFHPRTWCSFCPVGTMQNMLGGGKWQLEIDASRCRECGACEKACAFDMPIIASRELGRLSGRDCLKCSECVAACPAGALSFPGQKSCKIRPLPGRKSLRKAA